MNILSLIQDQVTPQTIGQISNAVGESPEATTSALGTAFPALLGSVVGKANASPTGATEILNLYAYRTSFTELNLGYGAALAMVLLAVTLAVSVLLFRLRRARA